MKKIAIAILFLLLSSSLFAQQSEKFTTKNNFEVSITGTSSLHDWECTVRDFSGYVTVEIVENKVTDVTAFSFGFIAENLESGKSSMDKKMHDAINAKKHPFISFKGNKVSMLSKRQLIFEGTFSINGTTKTLQMPAEFKLGGDHIMLRGKKDILLTDFDIEPPKALLGTITTGNLVTIHYNITLSK